MSSYNLNNNRVRARYTAATGDQIETQSFWPDFLKAATLRHNAIHWGRIATKAEAEDAVKAASSLVAHLNQIIR